METDPQNLDYKILSGARRQERRWDPTQNEQVVPEDKEVSKQLATDAMMRLEHGVEDKRKRDAAAPVLEKLESMQSRWKDDFACNQLLRKKFRVSCNAAIFRVQTDTRNTFRYREKRKNSKKPKQPIRNC